MIIQHGKHSRYRLTSNTSTCQDSKIMTKALSITTVLLDQLQSVYHRKAWHGPTLRGSLRGLNAHEAGETLTQSGHSIADIALHCAYWKYTVRRRLQNSKRG